MQLLKSNLLKLGIFPRHIFRKNSKRLLKVDDFEIDKLQFAHDVYRTIFNGNYSSPVTELLQEGAKVLDFRCGPGTWSCEMASDFKNSFFYGVDSISCFPVQKPLNVEFIKSKALNDKIPFENDFFDFIFVHSTILWYSSDQWEEFVIPELIRVLKPGGYLEIMEAELKLHGEGPETPIMTKHIEKFRASLRSHKINPYLILKLPQILKSTNQMINIQKDVRKCPVGNWDYKLGECGAKLAISIILQSLITTKLLRKKDYDDIYKKIVIEVNKVESYFCKHRTWAMKVS
ncbi:hypothetical protein RclHR1_02690012 [Rhizophagus clarus]|uniref:S-adenosyl-L-methionine-dependent methyltransferase n=1 Tax=Rhizophagus clarus TaxID=94130 RepID=A0A2Z6R159_9GLOM|nr:hypothetical protein RclHR1_02690012 [Rhizophagus clarus]GES95000.1 S-adenosyl-L-methionine-dependent methyltransferase [Rhizophagus clarus]